MSIKKYVVLLSPLTIILIRKGLSGIGVKSICLFKLITGHNCIGCGMTQAFIYILQGKFINAYNQNHLIIIVFPLITYLWLKYIYKNLAKQNS